MSKNKVCRIKNKKFNKSLIKLALDITDHKRFKDQSPDFNLWEVISEMSDEDLILLKQNDSFISLFKSISFISSDSKKEEKSIFEHAYKNNLPSIETPLSELNFKNKFDRLVSRVSNVFMDKTNELNGIYLRDLLTLNPKTFQSIPGVGDVYLNHLVELQSLYKDENLVINEKPILDFSPHKDEINQFRLFQANLNNRQRKAIAKAKKQNLFTSLYELVSVDKEKLMTLPGWGKSMSNSLESALQLIKTECDSHFVGTLNLNEFEGKFIVPENLSNLSFNDLDKLIVEDLNSFILKSLEGVERDVFESRFGVLTQIVTFEKLGKKYGVTRSRMQQIEKKLIKSFAGILRLDSFSMKSTLEDINPYYIKNKLPNLYAVFLNNEKNMISFLCKLMDDDSFYDLMYRGKVNVKCLEPIFAQFGAPISISDLKEVVEATLENKQQSFDVLLSSLSKIGKIKVDADGFVYPQDFSSKKLAVSCELSNYENGLHYEDVAKIVNKKGFCKNEVYDDRQDSAAFSHEYIYLAGKGVYKHTKWFDLDSVKMEVVFKEFDDFFEKQNEKVFHLSEIKKQSHYLSQMNYYDLRYLVKNFGEQYGFYFSGKSQTDSVGIEENFTPINQKNVILNAMNQNSFPLRIFDIAGLLKSKSEKHASYYLDGLIKRGLVVQVDYGKYTTPEKAFKKTDIETILIEINFLLSKEKPVHYSYVEHILNEKLNLSHNSHFYISIMKKWGGEKHWFRKWDLYDNKELEYASLMNLIGTVCDPGSDNISNLEKLNHEVLIEQRHANEKILKWKRDIERGQAV